MIVHLSVVCRPQSNALRPYLSAVRSTLTAALTLENFGSQVSSDRTPVYSRL